MTNASRLHVNELQSRCVECWHYWRQEICISETTYADILSVRYTFVPSVPPHFQNWRGTCPCRVYGSGAYEQIRTINLEAEGEGAVLFTEMSGTCLLTCWRVMNDTVIISILGWCYIRRTLIKLLDRGPTSLMLVPMGRKIFIGAIL